MADSNTQTVLDSMELHGKTEETCPRGEEIRQAVYNEMTGIWTRLSHRNRVYDGRVTNRGEEKLQWYVKSLENAAIKANKELTYAERRAAPFDGSRINTEIDNRMGDEALDNKRVSVEYFTECDVAFVHAEKVFTDITGEEWARPATFNNETVKVIVTAEQHAEISGIPVATTEARKKYSPWQKKP